MKPDSLLSNTRWGVGAQLLRSGLGFLFIPVVVSRLGTVQYGIFNAILLLSYSQGFFNQTDVGYFNFLTKHSAKLNGEKALKEFERECSYFFSTWVLSQGLICCIFVFSSKFVAKKFGIDNQNIGYFIIGSYLVLATNLIASLGSVYLSFLLSQQQNALVKKTETVCYFCFLVFAFLGLFFKKNVITLVSAFALSQCLQSFLYFFYVKQFYKRAIKIQLTPSLKFLKNWSDWKPFLFAKLNGLAIKQSDTAIVLFFGGPELVAYYDIATKIPSFLKVLMGRISESLITFSGANQNPKGQKLINNILSRLLFLQLTLSLALGCGALFYGKQILEAWLGIDISPQIVLGFKIAAFIPLFHAFSSSPAALLMGRDGRADLMTWGPTIVSVFNLVCSIPATYYGGIVGTISCTLLQFLLLAWILKNPISTDFGLNLYSIGKKTFLALPVIFGSQFIVYCLLKLCFNRVETILMLVTANSIMGIFIAYLFKSDFKHLGNYMTFSEESDS
ncbi:hypothetical protein EBQ74_04125 [bacterium]|nr:hypothetical protein [bacterium]